MKYFLTIILLVFGLSASLFAQNRSTQSSVTAALDTLALSIMEEHHLPGATIGVIHRDSVLYLKGFGYADIDDKRNISTDSTLFRLASISKTFTAVAVLQLAEHGEVDLHADINNYLPPELKMKPKFQK